MQMLMIVFRSSLKERVHQLLRECDVQAFTEINDALGQGQTGAAEGEFFNADTNSMIFAALDDAHTARIAQTVQAWYQRAAEHPGWQKPALRVFAMSCSQIA
jgi:hypothetical protein